MVKDEKITMRMAKEIPINASRNVLKVAKKADGFLSGRLASEADYGCFRSTNINNFLEGQAVHEIFVSRGYSDMVKNLGFFHHKRHKRSQRLSFVLLCAFCGKKKLHRAFCGEYTRVHFYLCGIQLLT
jgi:hypothetical protein